MGLTLDELEEIQAEALADDVEIDLARMQLWVAEEARAYFESGGTVVPVAPTVTPTNGPSAAASDALSDAPTDGPTAVDPALSTFLARHDLDGLAAALAGDTLAGLAAALRASGRAAFLASLKCQGVASLTHRQSLASALSKAEKTPGGLPAAAAAAGACEPTGGNADANARPLPPPLPPHVRLTRAQLAALAPRTERGEWYSLPLPTSFVQLRGASFGAAWLTAAMRAAGSLADSCAVRRIAELYELPLEGDDAQGGAGHKAILTVEYEGPAEALEGLHARLFVKMPWRLGPPAHASPALAAQAERYRHVLSSQYGDGDGLELSTYQYLAALLPVRIPRFYFGDIHRGSTNCILVTECIDYAPAASAASVAAAALPAGAILPKLNKYQDHRVQGAHEYYFALVRGLARIGAADKRGALGPHRHVFSKGFYPTRVATAPPPAVAAARRAQLRATCDTQIDKLVDFVTNVACGLFPPEQRAVTFLRRLKDECGECAQFFSLAQHHVASQADYAALTHPNLQIDNGFYWRDEAGTLQAGLLDWYSCGEMPFAAVLQGCLSGMEPHALAEHAEGLMRCFADEYVACGGPRISPAELLRQWRLLYVVSFVGQLQYIEMDIMREGVPRAEWPSIRSRDDPRIMNVWNVRCRTIAILDAVSFWAASDLHAHFMAWAREQGHT